MTGCFARTFGESLTGPLWQRPRHAIRSEVLLSSTVTTSGQSNLNIFNMAEQHP